MHQKHHKYAIITLIESTVLSRRLTRHETTFVLCALIHILEAYRKAVFALVTGGRNVLSKLVILVNFAYFDMVK